MRYCYICICKVKYKDQALTLYRNNKPEQVFLDLNYSPIFNEDKQPTGVLAVVVETTEQVVNRLKIQDSEKQLVNILESMGDAFFVLDKNNKYV